MKNRRLLFFVLMLASSGISKCEQQNPLRIFFINNNYLLSNILEFSDLKKEAAKLQYANLPSDHPQIKAHGEKTKKYRAKIKEKLNLIAKKLNASYVLEERVLGGEYYYANPSLDISKELVDALNKEYLLSLSKNTIKNIYN